MLLLRAVVVVSLMTACYLQATMQFVAFGDWGCDPTAPPPQKAEQLKISHVMASGRYPFDFVMALGDNFYNNGLESDKYAAMRFRTTYRQEYPSNQTAFFNKTWYAMLGNHDIVGDPPPSSVPGPKALRQVNYTFNALNMRSPENGRWHMPTDYYNVTRVINGVTAHMVVLNTNGFVSMPAPAPGMPDMDPHREAQKRWLNATLQYYKSLNDNAWVLVFGHHPPYSVGIHYCSCNRTTGFDSCNGPNDGCWMAEQLPFLLNGQAHAYFSGHDHDIQYFHCDDATSSNTTCSNVWGMPSNVHYVIAGAGGGQGCNGVSLRGLGNGLKPTVAFGCNTMGGPAVAYGFAHVQLTQDTMNLTLVHGSDAETLYTTLIPRDDLSKF
eukprot:TRINITY_DN67866_c2_g2_i1.p1 TRINITY_DN67866_c2_g2~~TRINITY_DN67866_c2_g2_i1.p1  ORF type:complete len:381 (-),score=22.53 TRINITY_DN67866_c2_g2_i1:447-1589(-)